MIAIEVDYETFPFLLISFKPEVIFYQKAKYDVWVGFTALCGDRLVITQVSKPHPSLHKKLGDTYYYDIKIFDTDTYWEIWDRLHDPMKKGQIFTGLQKLQQINAMLKDDTFLAIIKKAEDILLQYASLPKDSDLLKEKVKEVKDTMKELKRYIRNIQDKLVREEQERIINELKLMLPEDIPFVEGKIRVVCCERAD